MGSMGINIHFRSLSLAVNARCAPTKEPNSAMEMQGNANPQSTNLFLHRRTVEIAVPVAEDSLLVAIALCMGTPASKYAGREIKPPPPAIESTNPARKTMGHTIKKHEIVSVIFSFLLPPVLPPDPVL